MHVQTNNFHTLKSNYSKLTQAQQLMINLNQYNCIEIDKQYIRCKYFDFKSNIQKFTSLNINKNHKIKLKINNFEQQFHKYKKGITNIRQFSISMSPSYHHRSIKKVNSFKTVTTESIRKQYSKHRQYKTIYSQQKSNKKHLQKTSPKIMRSLNNNKAFDQKKTSILRTRQIVIQIEQVQSKNLLSPMSNRFRYQLLKKNQDQFKSRLKYIQNNKNISMNIRIPDLIQTITHKF